MQFTRDRLARTGLAAALLLSSALVGVTSAGAQEAGDRGATEVVGGDAVETWTFDVPPPPETTASVDGTPSDDGGAASTPLAEALLPQPSPTPVAAVSPTATPVPTATPTPVPAAAPAANAKLAATVVDNRFQPNALEISVGTTITWTNQGNNLHTLTSLDGLFDSGALIGGQSYSYTFTTAGTYRLICRQHGLNGMTAQVTVQ